MWLRHQSIQSGSGQCQLKVKFLSGQVWETTIQSGAWRGGNKPRYDYSETPRDTESKLEWLRVAGKTTLWFYVDFYVTDIKLNAKRL